MLSFVMPLWLGTSMACSFSERSAAMRSINGTMKLSPASRVE
jgi:hypothetical protein